MTPRWSVWRFRQAGDSGENPDGTIIALGARTVEYVWEKFG